MEELINYILDFGQLNEKQIELIKRNLSEITLTKGEYFSEAGKTAKRLGFVLEGVLRCCYYNNKGDEITRCFIEENNFVVDLNSFINQIPSAEYYEAVTDCRLIVLTHSNWIELSDTIVGWEAIAGKIMAKTMLTKVRNISSIISEDAVTSYQNFIKEYPNLVNRIPLSFIASYLGVTQSSLSRIRKKIR